MCDTGPPSVLWLPEQLPLLLNYSTDNSSSELMMTVHRGKIKHHLGHELGAFASGSLKDFFF